MTLRLFVDDAPLATGQQRGLPSGAARHAQVRRVQPGDGLVLFDGRGGEWAATVLSMGRSQVSVQVGEHRPVDRELACSVTLALGVPANERMDMLIEKATELGVAAVQPLVCQRSVLRLSGERAERKREHWRGVAVAASEQCGRTRVPAIAPMQAFEAWLAALDPAAGRNWLLSPTAAQGPGGQPAPMALTLLSGPEGGLSAAEEAAALGAGFEAVQLGPRILRAETAPLAVLAWLALGR